MMTGAERRVEQDEAVTPLAPAGRDIAECHALVTGSTGGLGLAMAEALAAAGASVMLHGVEPADHMEPVLKEMADRTGANVAYHSADLSTLDGAEALIDATVDRFGRLDILVNNAVVRHFATVAEFPPDAWEAALAVNLSAAFYTIRRALPGMRERNFGRIFNMTSVYGLRGTTNRVGYVATKSALLGVTRTVALENLDRNITCHCICPGSVLTPGTEDRVLQLMADNNWDRQQAEQVFLKGKQPGGRFVSPQSVSDLVVFLCGPVAQDMTGALLPVEAGWLVT